MGNISIWEKRHTRTKLQHESHAQITPEEISTDSVSSTTISPKRETGVCLRPSVLKHGGLLGVTFCLSVCLSGTGPKVTEPCPTTDIFPISVIFNSVN